MTIFAKFSEQNVHNKRAQNLPNAWMFDFLKVTYPFQPNVDLFQISKKFPQVWSFQMHEWSSKVMSKYDLLNRHLCNELSTVCVLMNQRGLNCFFCYTFIDVNYQKSIVCKSWHGVESRRSNRKTNTTCAIRNGEGSQAAGPCWPRYGTKVQSHTTDQTADPISVFMVLLFLEFDFLGHFKL